MNNVSIGSSFDDFLTEENIFEEVEDGSIKKLIAYQMQEIKKSASILGKRLKLELV